MWQQAKHGSPDVPQHFPARPGLSEVIPGQTDTYNPSSEFRVCPGSRLPVLVLEPTQLAPFDPNEQGL